MGPTVCELEGPMPMENKSKVEMTACCGTRLAGRAVSPVPSEPANVA
jgi:hypothetical protein